MISHTNPNQSDRERQKCEEARVLRGLLALMGPPFSELRVRPIDVEHNNQIDQYLLRGNEKIAQVELKRFSSTGRSEIQNISRTLKYNYDNMRKSCLEEGGVLPPNGLTLTFHNDLKGIREKFRDIAEELFDFARSASCGVYEQEILSGNLKRYFYRVDVRPNPTAAIAANRRRQSRQTGNRLQSLSCQWVSRDWKEIGKIVESASNKKFDPDIPEKWLVIYEMYDQTWRPISGFLNAESLKNAPVQEFAGSPYDKVFLLDGYQTSAFIWDRNENRFSLIGERQDH